MSARTEKSLTAAFVDALLKLPAVSGQAAAAGSRTLLNVLGTAVGACEHSGTIALAEPGNRAGGVAVPGRLELMSPLDAASASNGLLAAWLASYDLAGPDDALGGPGGFAAVLSETFEPSMLTDRLGEEWVLESNSFKPYPCGIVCHPAIDAGIALHDQLESVRDVAKVEVRCHPLVTELTGNPYPRDGLEAKFSTVHGIAAGIQDGQVGLAHYEDDAVRSETLTTLRSKIVLVVDPDVARDQATARLTTVHGTIITERIVHARGSLERPLSDQELLAKVTALVEPVLPGRVPAIASAVSGLAASRTLAALVESLTPEAGSGASHG